MELNQNCLNYSKTGEEVIPMAVEKINRSKNLTEHEKTLLKTIISRYSIIKNKQHTSVAESKKRTAWQSISNEFNANELIIAIMTIHKLQVRIVNFM